MRILSAVVLVGVGVAGYLLGHRAEQAPATPVQPPVTVAAPKAGAGVAAEGKIVAYPGAEVLVASENAGIVRTMRVHEQETVRKGQVLAELRNSDLLAAREEARARVREAEADIRLAGSDNGRTRDLVQRQFISRQALDRTERDLSAAQARLSSAQASLQRIDAQIDKTRIVAPIAGTVVIRHVDDGEAVAEGGPVATLADLGRLRVEAEIDEFDIGRIRMGDPVTLTAEGFENQRWQGRVEELPDAVRERAIRPQDVARPTDARVLLVKVALLERVPLKLGQRVEVTISTHASAIADMATPATVAKAM